MPVGMSTREIQGHLQEIYGAEVSPTLISEVTDAVIDELQQWQSRPLEPIYAIIYLDALMVKMRHEGRVENRAVYVAIGIGMDGLKDVLGLWTVDKEGSKAWLMFMTEFRNRGVKDVLIVCVDGLKGFPEAIETVFPEALVQLCIVHLVRNSLNYVNWKERKLVAADLRAVYTAPSAEAAEQELNRFGEKWDKRYGAHSIHVAAALGSNHSVLCVYAGNPESDVHHQRHRIVEHVATQDHQDAGIVSERTGGIEATLHGLEKRCGAQVAKERSAQLERCAEPVHGAVGGSDPSGHTELGGVWRRSSRQKSGHAPGGPGCRSSLIGDPGANTFGQKVRISTRKKKKQKERTVGRGRPVETAQPWKSIKVAFGNFCLMISTAA